MWLSRGETPNDLKAPDARAMDADRFHCAGPRRRDLHLAHRRSQVEINLWYARGAKEGSQADAAAKAAMKSTDSEKLIA
jgi:hypothetical protein